jgi:hypothetical protein
MSSHDHCRRGDSDNHEHRPNQAAFPGHRIPVLVPDGGDRGQRPPHRVPERGDRCIRCTPLRLQTKRSTRRRAQWSQRASSSSTPRSPSCHRSIGLPASCSSGLVSAPVARAAPGAQMAKRGTSSIRHPGNALRLAAVPGRHRDDWTAGSHRGAVGVWDEPSSWPLIQRMQPP